MVTARAGEIVLDSNRYKLVTPTRWQRQPVLRAARKIGGGDTQYSDYDLWNVKAWDTWHLGRGEEYFETDGRYYDSWNAETRIRGQITLGPHIYPTGLAGSLNYEGGIQGALPLGSLYYGFAESFVAPTGGFTADILELNLKRIGAGAGNITVSLCSNDVGAGPGGIDIPATPALKSKAIGASAIPTENFAWIEFDWDGTQALDAAATYWLVVSIATLGDTDNKYSVSMDSLAGYSGACLKTLESDWSAWSTQSDDLWFRLMGAEGELDSTPVRFAFYNDNGTEKLFCAAGTKVYAWNATTNVWADDTSGITGTVTDMRVFDDSLVVAQGTTANLRKKQSGSWGNLTDGEEGYTLGLGICPKGGDAGKVALIKSGPDTGTDMHKARCIAAIGDTWQDLKSVDGADTIVGDSSANITWIGQYQGSIWFGKEDGVYEVGKDGIAYNKFPFFTQKASWNFGASCVWHRNELMLPAVYGLWSFDGKSLKNIGPGVGLGYYYAKGPGRWHVGGVGEVGGHVGLPSDRQGVIRDLLPAVNALYAAIDGGTVDDRYSSIIQWTGRGWHELVRADAINKRIIAMGYTPAGTVETEARLWYGYGNNVFYCILPDTTDDPYQWSGSKFENQGYVEFGWFNAGLFGVDKDWRDVTIEAENVDDGSTLEIFYKLDDDTSYTSLGVIDDGTVGTAISNNQATLSFGTDTYGKRIKLKVYMATDDPDNTPKVTNVKLKYWTVPDVVWGFQFTLRLTDSDMDRSWGTQEDDLITTFEKKEPVTLVDPRGASHTVHLDKPAIGYSFSEVGHVKGALVPMWAYEA